MRVLVVDDSAVMRRIHKNTMIEHGIPEENIVEAEDGKIALAMAEKDKIDLFIVDWNMPKLNGFEFVEHIRSSAKYIDTPIIMVTSEAAKYNVIEAIEAGVTNYVVKPIKGELLWQKISKYIT